MYAYSRQACDGPVPGPARSAWARLVARFLPSFRRRRRICFAASLRGFLPSVHKITTVVTLTLTVALL